MKQLNVIGLNSGTSMDGIDAALFTISPLEPGSADSGSNGHVPRLKIEAIDSILHPFDSTFAASLQKLVAGGGTTLEQICLLNTALGELFADAAQSLMQRAAERKLDLIGSHGQTLWHAPARTDFWGVETAGTLQMGEPSIIAGRLGVPVVADFRGNDVAAGGQGAPLVAFADEVLFGKDGKPTAVLNIGGIANITILKSTGEAVMAFDTGPGNMMMDRAASVLFQRDFDGEGKIAAGGTIDEQWLSELLNLAYFKADPPKTTGRELFGHNFADKCIAEGRKRDLNDADIMATFAALTAASIARAYERFVKDRHPVDRLILGGGGADNKFLVWQLEKNWPGKVQICRHEDVGVSTKFKEALLFALLAYTTYFGIPNNVPACTGASRRVCLGKLVRP